MKRRLYLFVIILLLLYTISFASGEREIISESSESPYKENTVYKKYNSMYEGRRQQLRFIFTDTLNHTVTFVSTDIDSAFIIEKPSIFGGSSITLCPRPDIFIYMEGINTEQFISFIFDGDIDLIECAYISFKHTHN